VGSSTLGALPAMSSPQRWGGFLGFSIAAPRSARAGGLRGRSNLKRQIQVHKVSFLPESTAGNAWRRSGKVVVDGAALLGAAAGICKRRCYLLADQLSMNSDLSGKLGSRQLDILRLTKWRWRSAVQGSRVKVRSSAAIDINGRVPHAQRPRTRPLKPIQMPVSLALTELEC
jgi:hypothetical protein